MNNTEKRKPKSPIKFNIQLNAEQKVAKDIILNNSVITVLKGRAGSGKTILAANCALTLLFNRDIEKIIICRPAISKEDIGFLPGSADDKLQPYLQPVLDNFYLLYNKQKIDELYKEGIIQILPFAFMRGHTFANACVIVDEAQNLVHNMTELVIGRLGLNSKMIICGDVSQIDLKNKKDSGFSFLNTISQEIQEFNSIELLYNHRHPIVEQVLNIYKKYE